MELITKLIPKEYTEYSDLLYRSVKYSHISKREHRIYYLQIDFKKIVEEILLLNEKNKFLLNSEIKYLEFLNKIFKKRNIISVEEYSKLIELCFLAVDERINKTKQELIEEIKKGDLKASKLDDRFLFVVDNLQKQLKEVSSQFKKVVEKRGLDIGDALEVKLARTIFYLFENYSNIIFTIANKDFEQLDSAITSALDLWEERYIRLNPDVAIIA